MQDAGRVSPDRHTAPHIAGVSPSPPTPGSAPANGLGAIDPQAAGHSHAAGAAAPRAAKKPATCLDESQVLEATARVLREKGYDGTTIRAIAKQLSCAVGSIYRYFPDKRALLDGVCQRRFEAVAEYAELRSGVRQSVQMYARVASEQPELYRLMFWLSSVGKRQMGEALPGVVRRVIAGWAEALGDQARAKALWAQLHGCIMLGLPPEQAVTMLDLPAATPAERMQPLPQAVAEPAATMSDTMPASLSAQAPMSGTRRDEDVTLL